MMKTSRFLITIICLFNLKANAQSPYILVLGTAQDGGHPQAGCEKSCCSGVYDKKVMQHWASSIALIDPKTKERWIFDATPDFAEQLHFLKQQTNDFSNRIDGVFLTHAHIGHYTGLMDLGHEVMGTKNIPVYAMPKMADFLTKNGPWSQLVNYNNIALQPLENQKVVRLNERISVEPFVVPHRDEFSETVGYKIVTDRKTLVFIPDIDKWSKWEQSLTALVTLVDYALLDGTFYADGEIARPMNEVPHPFVTETMELLRDLPETERNKVHFIHLNHTNPLLNEDSESYKNVLKKRFNVTAIGQLIEL